MASTKGQESNGTKFCCIVESNSSLKKNMPCVDRLSKRLQWSPFIENQLTSLLEELRSPLFWTEVVMEALTSFLLGCFTIWIKTTLDEKFYVPTGIAIATFAGVYVCTMVDATGPYDYAMFNPIVSWGFFLNGRLSFIRMVIYQALQFSGVTAGAMFGVWLTPDDVRLTLKPVPLSNSLTAVQGGLIEAVISFNLVFVSLSVTMPSSKNTVIPGLTIGLAVFIGLLSAGTRTGGLLSPSVSLAYAVASNDFSNLWAYWIGEYSGATIASLFAKLIVSVRTRAENDDPTRHQGVSNIAETALPSSNGIHSIYASKF